MKTTLSQNRQLFVVNQIANAGLTPDNIPEGAFGIVNTKTGTTVKPDSFSALPDEFSFISKKGGKTYYSFDEIKKKYILNQTGKEYTEAQSQIWKAVIEDCSCLESVRLDIFLDETSLIMQNGLTWTHRDNYVEVSPEEFKCYCDCEGKGTYENNVLTMLLYKNIIANNSPFYTAEVHVVGGSKLDGLSAIESFIETNKDVNTDDDKDNDGKKLELHLIGKQQTVPGYRDLEPNYMPTRGVRLKPTLTINGNTYKPFEKVQDVKFEVGAGYDVKAEEFSILSLYTNLHQARMFDGFADPNLIYQTDESQKYDAINFEFDSPKQNRAGEGDKKRFSVLLVSVHGNGMFDKLKKIFDVD